jgi:hypothetical protein
MADITWIDSVFGQRPRTVRIFGHQLVAIKMKVADQGHMAPHIIETRPYTRHGFGGRRGIDGNTHQFGSGTGELGHLRRCRNFVFRIGIGHGLNHYRGTAADRYRTDAHADTVAAGRKNIL